MNWKRRDFLKASGGAAAATIAAPGLLRAQESKPKRPNIVLIMADDMGFSDVGCYGGEIETPNIDSLAQKGRRYTQFYNCAKCGPTRASLLTGLYHHQTGAYSGMQPLKHGVTLGEVLKSAGYRTLISGKWHHADKPVDRGFDRYYGLADGCCNFFNPGLKREGEPEPGRKSPDRIRRWMIDDKVYEPYTPEKDDFYTTDEFTTHAISFLDEYQDEDNPFFLYMPYTAPHYPLHAWPEDIAKYRGKYMKGWDKVRQERYERMKKMGIINPDWPLSPRDEGIPAWEDAENKDEWDLKMAVYAAMIDRMDQNIGRLLQKIRDLGEEDNTLVLFLVDNGGCAEVVHATPDIAPGPVESYRTLDEPWANVNNTPFRKYKRWDHEGGISTPLIAYWPNVIKNGGEINHDMVGHLIDLMPTFCELTGAEYPKEFNGKNVPPMEGISLVSALMGDHIPEREDAIYWEFGGAKAMRDGKWKLVAERNQDWELYDIEADRVELNNLASKYPERVKQMAKRYYAWAERCNVRL